MIFRLWFLLKENKCSAIQQGSLVSRQPVATLTSKIKALSWFSDFMHGDSSQELQREKIKVNVFLDNLAVPENQQ